MGLLNDLNLGGSQIIYSGDPEFSNSKDEGTNLLLPKISRKLH